MECPKCHSLYQKEKNIPLLLIKCGHTLCKNCADTIFTGKSISCPDCGCISAIESVSLLPKNMALLSMFQPSLQFSTATSNDSRNAACGLHEKKVEAFCLDDKVLLCIDCILLDGHKAHDITPISKAYEKELSELRQKVKSVENIEESLIVTLSNINDYRMDANTKADECKEKIENLFNEIRVVIDEREASLKQNIDDVLESEERVLDEVTKDIRNHLDSISVFKDSASEMNSESECALLESSHKREKLAIEAIRSPPKIPQRHNFIEIRRDVELSALWKLLKPATTSSTNIIVNKCANKKKPKKKSYVGNKKQKPIKKKGEAMLETAISPKRDKKSKVPLIDLSKYCVPQNEKILCGSIVFPKRIQEDIKTDIYDNVELTKTEPINLYGQQTVGNENIRSSLINMEVVQNDHCKVTNFCSLKEKREKHKREQEMKEEALQELSINESSAKELSPEITKISKLDCITPIMLESYVDDNDYDRINLQSLLKSTNQYIYAICKGI